MIYLVCCFSCDFHLELIGHHVRFYSNLGVGKKRFLYVLHSTNKENLEFGKQTCLAHGVSPKVCWSGKSDFRTMYAIKKELIKNSTINKRDWIVHCDVDEFHDYHGTLEDAIIECETSNAIGIIGNNIDRISADGVLNKLESHIDLPKQFPICGYVRFQYDPLEKIQQVMLYRSGTFTNHGGHKFILDKGNARTILYKDVHHFKYHKALLDNYGSRRVVEATPRLFMEYYDKYGKIRMEDIEIQENNGEFDKSDLWKISSHHEDVEYV